jgi:hypothetical protein
LTKSVTDPFDRCQYDIKKVTSPGADLATSSLFSSFYGFAISLAHTLLSVSRSKGDSLAIAANKLTWPLKEPA